MRPTRCTGPYISGVYEGIMAASCCLSLVGPQGTGVRGEALHMIPGTAGGPCGGLSGPWERHYTRQGIMWHCMTRGTDIGGVP